jgi:hypothetical protein
MVYSTLSTPNARMKENDRTCAADDYPKAVKAGLPKIKLKISSYEVDISWVFPDSTGIF